MISAGLCVICIRKRFVNLNREECELSNLCLYAAWFTLEFLCRFVSCPKKLQFIRQVLNIIDVCAVCVSLDEKSANCAAWAELLRGNGGPGPHSF